MTRVRFLVLLPFLVAATHLHNEAAKVRDLVVPSGWTATSPSSDARLIGAWENKDGARMSLVAERVKDGVTASALLADARSTLARQGFKDLAGYAERPGADGRERARLDGSLDGGRVVMHQLYVVADGFGYVLTVAGASKKAPELKRAFDEVSSTLAVGDGVLPSK
jgi:hypothetical protein